MKLNKSRQDSIESLAEINIIPFVDITLVLLIIFMVAAPMLQEGIKIDLPQVSAASVDMKKEDVILSIDDLGQIFINDNKKDKFSIVSIEDKLMIAFKERKEKTVYLRADQSIRYGYLMEVMAACRRAGVEKIGMMTQTNDEKKLDKKYKKKRTARR